MHMPKSRCGVQCLLLERRWKRGLKIDVKAGALWLFPRITSLGRAHLRASILHIGDASSEYIDWNWSDTPWNGVIKFADQSANPSRVKFVSADDDYSPHGKVGRRPIGNLISRTVHRRPKFIYITVAIDAARYSAPVCVERKSYTIYWCVYRWRQDSEWAISTLQFWCMCYSL